MRFGLQTISWGHSLRDPRTFRGLLRCAQKCGFRGIEFAQHPHLLPDPQALFAAMASAELEVIGFSGGSLERRLEFASGRPVSYFYSDTYDESGIDAVLMSGGTVGLHPHFGKELSDLEEAKGYISQKVGQMGLILDSAHLHLLNRPFDSAVRDYFSDVLAVHVKDWKFTGSRSSFDYALHFASLGDGELGGVIEAGLRYLEGRSFEGWIVVEQDRPDRREACQSAKSSADWLRSRGFLD